MLDCVVVGAGPAGSTTAKFAASGGANTLIIDRKKDVGKPVQCGEFIPRVPEMLKLLPALKNPEELFALDESLVSKKTDSICIRLPSGKEYTLGFAGQTIDRDRYDQHLLKLAKESGADFKVRRAIGLERGTEHWIVKTDKGDIKAKIVVGADGPHSKIAGWADLEGPAELSQCIIAWSKGDFGVDVKFIFGKQAPGGYAWVMPKKDGANIGLGVQSSFLERYQDNDDGGQVKLKGLLDGLLEELNAKAERFSTGFVPVSGPVPQSMTNGLLLVGDAAGQVMASNGGGLPPALICGRLAGQVIASRTTQNGILHTYESRWRELVGGLLQRSLKTKQMADRVFGSDSTLEWSMRLLGKRGLARMIRSQNLFL